MAANPRPLEKVSYQDYEYLKAAWIKAHPDASPEEYERAMRKLAKELGV